MPDDVRARCLPLAERACSASRVRIVKTIRMPLDWIPRLVERDSTNSVKFVYMLRDPRGRWWSSVAKALSQEPNLSESYHEVVHQEQVIWCKRLLDEYHWLKYNIRQCYSRLFMLKYEDLAQNPQEYAQQLYSFLGLTLTSEIKEWLKSITHADKDGGFMNTDRQNSSRTASRWHQHMPIWAHKITTDACKPALDVWNFK